MALSNHICEGPSLHVKAVPSLLLEIKGNSKERAGVKVLCEGVVRGRRRKAGVLNLTRLSVLQEDPRPSYLDVENLPQALG